MTPNLHVALALALGRPTSTSDAALLDEVRRLRAGGGAPVPVPLPEPEPIPLFDLEGVAS